MAIFDGQMEEFGELFKSRMRDLYAKMNTYIGVLEDTGTPLMICNFIDTAGNAYDNSLSVFYLEITDIKALLDTFNTSYGTEFTNYYGATWGTRLTNVRSGLGDIITGIEDNKGSFDLYTGMTNGQRTALADVIKTALGIS